LDIYNQINSAPVLDGNEKEKINDKSINVEAIELIAKAKKEGNANFPVSPLICCPENQKTVNWILQRFIGQSVLTTLIHKKMHTTILLVPSNRFTTCKNAPDVFGLYEWQKSVPYTEQ
jgi:hypothetical protein